jgi:hypothetical protein
VIDSKSASNLSLFIFLLCNLLQSIQWFGCVCRQKGKSYLGIIDDAQGSNLTVLDIPFTDIENIVIFIIVSFPSFCISQTFTQ